MTPLLWLNPDLHDATSELAKQSISFEDIERSEARLMRFGPYLAEAYGQLPPSGIIESPLVNAQPLLRELVALSNRKLPGQLWLKCDHQLPISGSIKARGGIYEVLKYAEQLALEHRLLRVEDDYRSLASDECRALFAKYSVTVGSTGNLGLAIGMISAKIGFSVTVHMSSDAKAWKKDKLRVLGVNVVEHQGDYGEAVTAGRALAKSDPYCHFIDDENSVDLFMGYSVAALRLEQQLKQQHITVDSDHPLFVYLPCGVGGAPGGISWGLKNIFKDNVHCFFAEPTHSPAMLLGLYTGLHQDINVNQLGIDNKTQADGLAVGCPSKLVSQALKHLINGCYTLTDDTMFELLALTYQSMKLTIEPSAAAGIAGITRLLSNEDYLIQHHLTDKLNNITHIAWTTGGDMVPEPEMTQFIKHGEDLLRLGQNKHK